jgi:hypothetical protein
MTAARSELTDAELLLADLGVFRKERVQAFEDTCLPSGQELDLNCVCGTTRPSSPLK